MLLAKREGNELKIKDYMQSIVHLKEALEDKVAATKDVDRKNDLKILHKNVMTLWKHVQKDFKYRGGKKGGNEGEATEATA